MAIIGKSLILVQHFWRETCLPQMRMQWGPADTGSCKPRSRSSPALRGDTVSRQCNCRKSRFSLLIRIVVSGTVSALLRRSEPSITRCHQILTGTSLCIPTRAASARGQGDLNGR